MGQVALLYMSYIIENMAFVYAKTKTQICAVTAQLISAFVFATPVHRQYKISSFWSFSMTVQTNLCQNWSETP